MGQWQERIRNVSGANVNHNTNDHSIINYPFPWVCGICQLSRNHQRKVQACKSNMDNALKSFDQTLHTIYLHSICCSVILWHFVTIFLLKFDWCGLLKQGEFVTHSQCGKERLCGSDRLGIPSWILHMLLRVWHGAQATCIWTIC